MNIKVNEEMEEAYQCIKTAIKIQLSWIRFADDMAFLITMKPNRSWWMIRNKINLKKQRAGIEQEQFGDNSGVWDVPII